MILGVAVRMALVLEIPSPYGGEKIPSEEKVVGVAEGGRSKVADGLRSCLTAAEIDDAEIS